MPATVFSSDLAATQYSAAATNFLATWDGVRSGAATATPGVHFDGDFTVAATHGHHLLEYPFAHEGDAVSQVVRQRYWQLAANFKPQALGTASPGRADWLLLEEENFRDEGGGIVSWDRVYATIPRARDVFEDFPYSAQYMYAENGTVRLAEQTFTVASRVRCEYFHIRDLASWSILLALRIVQLTSNQYTKRGVGNLSLTGSLFVSTDAQIVAEDSKLRIWRYPIMERRTRYVAGPTLEFWGDAFSI